MLLQINMKQKKPTDLRENIASMIEHIETMVSDINLVLGDIGVLVKDIDSITERIENTYTCKHKNKRPEFLIDANGNQCELKTETTSPEQLQFCMPSPYLDYTYLELSKDCGVCDDHFHKFTYNEKYPLWMQYDSWKTGNTAWNISLVSAETDFSHVNKSDDVTYNHSWKNGLNIADNRCKINVLKSKTTKTKTMNKTMDKTMPNFEKCCKSDDYISDQYCGVYEHMMEQQLDGIKPALHDELVFDNDTDTNNQWSDLSNDYISDCSISLPDEYAIHSTI